MESFVGLRVRLDLRDGARMEGIINDLDESRQLMTLSEAVCENMGCQPSRFPGLLEVCGGDVVHLEILPRGRESEMMEAVSRSGSPLGLLKDSPRPRPKGKNDRGAEWTLGEVKTIKGQDFDFQANLELFDKRRIFSEIRAQDSTGVGERLVEHNLSGRGQQQRQQRQDQIKMKHTEKVLARPADDDDEDDRIISAKSPLCSKQATVLLKTTNGHVIDLSRIHSTTTTTRSSYPSIIVETGALALATHILGTGNCNIEFYTGPSLFLEAICYCAARHLILAGFSVSIAGQSESSDDDQGMKQVLQEHASFYRQVLLPMNRPALALPDETLTVNATESELERIPPRNTTLVSLNFISRRTTGQQQQQQIILFDLEAARRQADALQTLHPRNDLFLVAGSLLFDDDLEARRIFAQEKKDATSSVSYASLVRLHPFIR